jgi:hypothetical protein
MLCPVRVTDHKELTGKQNVPDALPHVLNIRFSCGFQTQSGRPGYFTKTPPAAKLRLTDARLIHYFNADGMLVFILHGRFR